MPFEDLKEIYKTLEKVPLVEMKYSVAKTNSDEEVLVGETLVEGGEAMVMINIKRTNRYNKQWVAASNFPKPKECTWFLLIGNEETNELVAMKRIAFKRFASKNLNICLPKNFKTEKLKVFLLCDSYIGLDQEYTIDFNKVNAAIRRQSAQKQEDPVEDQGFVDPEVESQAQPQTLGLEREEQEDASYPSLFSHGYETFELFQKHIVSDIVSDDEGEKAKTSKKAAARKNDQQIDSSGGGQIHGGRGEVKERVQKEIFDNIQFGIEMLLDSDDDLGTQPQEDGMIEKDMDNWI